MSHQKKSITFEKTSFTHLGIMKFIALIPIEGTTLNFICSQLLTIYFHFISLLYNACWSGYGVRMIRRKVIEIDYLCELAVVQCICLRYLIMCMNREKVMRLIETCKKLWTYLEEDEGKIVRKYERKAHYFRTFMMCNSLSIGSLYFIPAAFLQEGWTDGNGTVYKNLPFKFMIEVHEGPIYTFALILQTLLWLFVPIMVAGVETVALYLIMMASGYLCSIKNRLLQLAELDFRNLSEKDLLSRYEKVLACARFHQGILTFCEDIESLTGKIFFIQVFATIYNMSITGLQIMQGGPERYQYLGIFLLNLFQFFTCQWAPEILCNESKAIGTAAYFASFRSWQYEPKTLKLLLQIMMRSQKPVQLTAGGYINLSIETFGSMVKNAFSFFTLLRNFNL